MNSDTYAYSYDFVVVGSGFGGSVSAMRLAQKGYSVLVLEKGKRWRSEDFPKSNWNTRKYFWAPIARCFGFQSITVLNGLMVLHGTGVGGGSLVYANTLLIPASQVFKDPAWPKGVDWEAELRPHYETAKKMLGVTQNRHFFEGEQALKKVGEVLGVGSTFRPTDVGVYFGEPGKTARDPYFSGEGPPRTGCVFCGGCMVGCRHSSKNSLDFNYLYFAEKWGATIQAETVVEGITPLSEGGYEVTTYSSTGWFKRRKTIRVDKLILAAGALGTLSLLFKNKKKQSLKNLPETLGSRVRTNGESLVGATSFEAHRDLSRGIAIGASIQVDARTKIENVRYSKGSGAMRLLAIPLTGQGSWWSRPLKFLVQCLVRAPRLIRLLLVRDWARSSQVLLVMQSIDQELRLRLSRSLWSGLCESLHTETGSNSVPSFFPVAQKAAQILADEIRGEPQNVMAEVLLQTPATAHILGGAVLADSPERGVVDLKHEVFGYPGLYVCDASVIPANLGVNPSLTITALAERFASGFPAASIDTQPRNIRFGPA